MLASDLPPGPRLVDSDVFSYIHYGKDRYRDFEPFLVGHPLFLSFCTVGELRGGAIKNSWGSRRRQQQDDYIHRYTIVRPTTAVVDEYAALHAKLHDQLKGGGVNDMWTAACALYLSTPVVTNNLGDFTKIRTVEPRLVIAHPDLPSPAR